MDNNTEQGQPSQTSWYDRWHQNPSHRIWHWFLFLIGAAFVLVVVMVAKYSYDQVLSESSTQLTPVSVTQKTQYTKLSTLTSQVLKLADAYQHNPNQSSLLALKAAIQTRQDALVNAAQSNPSSVLAVALNQKATDTLPAAVKNLVEQDATVEGNLFYTHTDSQDNSTDEFALETSDGQLIQLNVSDEASLNKLSDFKGKKIRVTGKMIDHHLVANKGANNVTVLSNVKGATTSQVVKKVAVIMFNWQNDTSQPITADQARTGLFTSSTSAGMYHTENSYGHFLIQGKTRTDGDVIGYYTIPYSSGATCDNTTIWSWGDAAMTQAEAAGWSPTGYDFGVFVFPHNSACGWAGASLIYTSRTLPYREYINGSTDYATWVLGHELGHLLGNNHANSYTCKENGVYVAISVAANCTSAEYKDPYDIMGNSGLNSHENGYHKYNEGAYSSSNMQTVTASGTYTIAPIESNTSAVQTIKIPRAKTSTGTIADSYYLDFRQPIGFDSRLSSSSYASEINGVGIHIADCTSSYVNCPLNSYATSVSNKTLLIDATPDGNFTNSALPVGATFTDSTYGISVKTLSVSSTGASVQISIAGSAPTCTQANPAISISPTSQWGTPGQALSYSVSVTNNDSSGCSGDTFTVSPTLPSGFTQSPTSLSFSLTPGNSATNTISLTSVSTAVGGTYQFTENAVNAQATSYKASASANYNISTTTGTGGTTPAHINLSPSTLNFYAISGSSTPAAQSATLGNSGQTTLNWTATTDQTWCHVNPTSGTVAAAGSTGLSVSVDAPSNIGTFTCNVAVSDPAADNTPQAIAVSYAVSAPPPADTTPPTVTITSPANGSTLPSKGSVNVTATASDSSGILAIKILIDNAQVKTCSNVTSCTYKWNPGKIAAGSHTIQASATDKANNVGTTSITVNK